jgi:ketosteroid isomerase-like protein
MNVPNDVLAAMQRTNELFEAQVVGRQNVDDLDRVYTSNARVLPPGSPMLEGREQAKTFWRGAITALGLKSAKLTSIHAKAVGDCVIEIGRADLLVGSGNTATVKYVVQWKQEDGNWKWDVDIWNANG